MATRSWVGFPLHVLFFSPGRGEVHSNVTTGTMTCNIGKMVVAHGKKAVQ